MKKITAIIIILALFTVVSGCADTKVINGTEYDTYGLINKDEKQNDAVHYEVVWGNIVWGSILFGTVVAPVYFFGFSMWEPVGPKVNIKGQVAQ